jgi:hypothetical protein
MLDNTLVAVELTATYLKMLLFFTLMFPLTLFPKNK